MKLNKTTATTVRTLANLAANSLRYGKLMEMEHNRTRMRAEARAFIVSAKIVVEHAKILGLFEKKA